MTKLIKKKNICFVTSTRADYGLFSNLLKNAKKIFDVKIIVTGTHLSKHHGLTINEIKKDGFDIFKSISILKEDSDQEFDMCESISKTINKFNQIFEKNNFDLIVILGDRYEIFSVATAARVRRIPIAHIHGGEVTSNALDESFRHSITLMSQIHFVAAKKYYNRVMQLGKNPKNIYLVGSLGVSNIKSFKLYKKVELEKNLNINFANYNFFLIYHPETLEKNYGFEGFKNLCRVLEEFRNANIFTIFSNSDTGYLKFNKKLLSLSKKKNIFNFKSLDHQSYLSLVKHCDLIIGNSSSGIIEAPSLKVPTVNIGKRQHGRLRSNSIIDCDYKYVNIKQSISKAIKLKKKLKTKLIKNTNPYDHGNAIKKIIKIMNSKKTYENLNIKKFYDL